MVRAFATISMLCAGALARRNEETTGFVQIKEMKADLSQMSYLEDVKTSLKKMALNRAAVPDEAMEAINTITQKLADILPHLGQEKKNDADDQTRILGLFTTAQETYTNTMQTTNDETVSTSLWSLQDAARTTYENCRATESIEFGEKTVCDGEQSTKQQTFDNKVTAVSLAQSGAKDTTCQPTDQEIYAFTTDGDVGAVDGLYNAIDELITAKGELATKTGECDGKTNDYNNQHDQCDNDQNALEDAACNWARAYDNAETAYSGSYDGASGQYDSDVTRWGDNSANRKAQCELVAKITCYVKALKDNNAQADLETAIQDCDGEEGDFDCDQYVLAIEEKPTEITRQTTPATVCDDNFDYGTAAANTALGDKQACCVFGR